MTDNEYDASDIVWPSVELTTVSGVALYSNQRRRWVGRPLAWLAGRLDRAGFHNTAERLDDWAFERR